MPSTLLGPGTLEIGDDDTTTTDYACEILGGKITHTYEDVGEARTMLCGTARPSTRTRTDGLGFTLENDLTAAGLYQWLLTNDLQEKYFAYTPNTAGAAAWSGTFQASLPAEIGADEYGSPIVSDVEWTGIGTFTFTPATTTP